MNQEKNHHPATGTVVPIVDDQIHMEDWGKDHWSLLAYIDAETMNTLGPGGRLDPRRLRTNPERHPLLLSGYPKRKEDWDPSCGTRLHGFFEDRSRRVPWHDDWDVLEDLVAAGLVTLESTLFGFDGKAFGPGPKVALTEKGAQVAFALRRHKQAGGQFATFHWPGRPERMSSMQPIVLRRPFQARPLHPGEALFESAQRARARIEAETDLKKEEVDLRIAVYDGEAEISFQVMTDYAPSDIQKAWGIVRAELEGLGFLGALGAK